MSQRKRSRRAVSDESEDDVSQEAPRASQKRRKVDSDDEGDTQGTQKKPQITHQERQKLIGEMMRFMLFSESHKKPLRKDEVNKHVMKNYKNRKLYDEILAEAKHQLQSTFGYEVVELVPEAGKKTSNTQYAMINKLAGNPLLLEYVETPDAQELTLLTTILDMIYINDELLEHDILYEQLGILGLHKGEHHAVFGDWDKMVNNWIRQGYITKKRNDSAREGQITYEYTLGPRALHVVTRKNLLKHVAAVLNEDVDPIRAKELEDKERENRRNNNNAEKDAEQEENNDAVQQSSQPVQRSTNNNNNTFRPMVGTLPSGSNTGRQSTATYSKKGRSAKSSTLTEDDD